MSSQRVIAQYLERYAEPESRFESEAFVRAYSACLVLPIYSEQVSNLNRFLELPDAQCLLSVWVFNVPDSNSNSISNSKSRSAPDSDSADKSRAEQTQKAFSHFLGQFEFTELAPQVFLCHVSDTHDLILIDRCLNGAPIPFKQGVGLARKIGADVALRVLQSSNSVAPEPSAFIHFCDVDVRLPSDYFIPTFESEAVACGVSEKPVAMLYPFEHVPDAGLEIACALYDFKLRYYTEQLASVGSPYAYQALGSIIMLDPLAYAQVRGVPKRSGAEDFYLLNKLAKVGRIVNLDGPLLKISGRRSERVPFGTGPAIDTISALEHPVEQYLYYHPTIFVLLKQVFDVVDRWCSSDYSLEYFRSQLELTCPKELELICDVLGVLKIEKLFRHCAQQKISPQRFSLSFHHWLDAFLTLRFVHILRDKAYKNVSIAHLESEGGILSPQLLLAKEQILESTLK